MTKIIMNISHTPGCPKGSNKSYIAMRNGYIMKAWYKGMRRKSIATLMGLSNQLVSKVIKDNKCKV